MSKCIRSRIFARWSFFLFILGVSSAFLQTAGHAEEQSPSSELTGELTGEFTGQEPQDVNEQAGQLATPHAANYAAPTTSVEPSKTVMEDSSEYQRLYANYFAILYGPSVGDPSSYQPSSSGEPDLDRPVFLKNFLTAGYYLTESISISGSAYWHWKPVLGQELSFRDPYIRIAHDSLISVGNFNLYLDGRVHFGVSNFSRELDMITGLQAFTYASLRVGSRLTLGVYGSARGNFYGGQGSGIDGEFYLGPNLVYQIGPKVAFTLLYEMGASHQFGDPAMQFTSDGTGLEPGISWDITPNLNINPYLHLYVGDRVTAKSTSLGMTLSWLIL